MCDPGIVLLLCLARGCCPCLCGKSSLDLPLSLQPIGRERGREGKEYLLKQVIQKLSDSCSHPRTKNPVIHILLGGRMGKAAARPLWQEEGSYVTREKKAVLAPDVISFCSNTFNINCNYYLMRHIIPFQNGCAYSELLTCIKQKSLSDASALQCHSAKVKFLFPLKAIPSLT